MHPKTNEQKIDEHTGHSEHKLKCVAIDVLINRKEAKNKLNKWDRFSNLNC